MDTSKDPRAKQAEVWVTVYEPLNQAETPVIVALLQDAGFQTHVQQESIGAIFGLSVGQWAALIQVPSTQQEAAEEFLVAHFEAMAQEPVDE